jgi:hypothetical protein
MPVMAEGSVINAIRGYPSKTCRITPKLTSSSIFTKVKGSATQLKMLCKHFHDLKILHYIVDFRGVGA